jgi:fermentation-respiration switch protein FrsA (DUF1100 family)
VAIDLASREGYKNRVAGVIVENTFSSLAELVLQLMPKCFTPLIRFLELKRKFPTVLKVANVSSPILFISGLKDKFIPPAHSTQLYMVCRASQKHILRVPDGEHLNTWNKPDHTEAVKGFISNFVNNNDTAPAFSLHFFIDSEEELG